MAKKKVCCSFDYEHDRIYYNLLEAWNENDDIDFSINDCTPSEIQSEWLRGFALWEWAPKLPSASEAWKDDSYEICEKPVQEIIKRFYEHEAGTSLM